MKKIVTTEEYDDNGILKKKIIEEFMQADEEKQIEYVPYTQYIPIGYYTPIEYSPSIPYNPWNSPWYTITITG